MNSCAEQFFSQKYLILKNILEPNLREIFVHYAKFQSMYDFTPEGEGGQNVGTHSRYGDFLTESMLLYLQSKIEIYLGEKLSPTYSYFRVYKRGDSLEPHVDREACEISLSVAFGWHESVKPWPFKIANDKKYVNGTKECHTIIGSEGIDIHLEPGDGLLYLGTQVKHWREPLDQLKYVQAFFHYVRCNGPCAQYVFDNRGAIGVPKINTAIDYFNHSKLVQALITYYENDKVPHEQTLPQKV